MIVRLGLRPGVEPGQLIVHRLVSGRVSTTDLGVKGIQVALEQGRVELERQAARGSDGKYSTSR